METDCDGDDCDGEVMGTVGDGCELYGYGWDKDKWLSPCSPVQYCRQNGCERLSVCLGVIMKAACTISDTISYGAGITSS